MSFKSHLSYTQVCSISCLSPPRTLIPSTILARDASSVAHLQPAFVPARGDNNAIFDARPCFCIVRHLPELAAMMFTH